MSRFFSRDLTGQKGVHNILKELKGKKKKKISSQDFCTQQGYFSELKEDSQIQGLPREAKTKGIHHHSARQEIQKELL